MDMIAYVMMFFAGIAFTFAAIAAWGVGSQKRLAENPLSQQEKRVIRNLAQEATGREFIWSPDGKLALWK